MRQLVRETLRSVNRTPTCPSAAPVPRAATRTWSRRHCGQDALAAGAAGRTRIALVTPVRSGRPARSQILADVAWVVNRPARWYAWRMVSPRSGPVHPWLAEPAEPSPNVTDTLARRSHRAEPGPAAAWAVSVTTSPANGTCSLAVR